MSIQDQIVAAAVKKDELLKVLSDTDYPPLHLKSNSNSLKSWRCNYAIPIWHSHSSKPKRESNLKEHEKYRDSHVRRFMYRATGKKERFADKASKGEQDYFGVLQEAQQENNRNATLKQQVNDAKISRDELQSLAQVHDNAQHQLDDLKRRIFTGQTEGFPEEDECESRCNGMLTTYRECRGKWEAETSAMHSLSGAARFMNNSIREINSALSYSRWDMFGGGTMADAMERNALARSDQAAMQTKLHVSKAQRASPFVQNLPSFDINHGHIFSDVFFYNIFADMRFHEEIQRAARELERCAVVLRNELIKTKERRVRLETEVVQREADLSKAGEELQRIKE